MVTAVKNLSQRNESKLIARGADVKVKKMLWYRVLRHVSRTAEIGTRDSFQVTIFMFIREKHIAMPV